MTLMKIKNYLPVEAKNPQLTITGRPKK